jgi:hypothetical protein
MLLEQLAELQMQCQAVVIVKEDLFEVVDGMTSLSIEYLLGEGTLSALHSLHVFDHHLTAGSWSRLLFFTHIDVLRSTRRTSLCRYAERCCVRLAVHRHYRDAMRQQSQ